MSLVTPVAVYLATHPGAELTGDQIAMLWGVNRESVNKTLNYAVIKGWVTITLKPNPTKPTAKKIRVYTAGPRLLQEIAR
jgi:DNA-binding transcriptional regulator LsrR (DeoR family)